MYRQESDNLFRALASSGAVLPELIKYWQHLKDDSQKKLSELSVAALFNSELQQHALAQYGKVQMLTELIDHAKNYRSE